MCLYRTERADTFTDLERCPFAIVPVGQKPTVTEIGKIFVLSRLEDTLCLACHRILVLGTAAACTLL